MHDISPLDYLLRKTYPQSHNLQQILNSLLAKAKWGNYGETWEKKHGKWRPKIQKDEGWLWNTYSWHGGVGRRRAVSNFTLIGKKNGMMDIIRSNMNEKKKKSHMSCMNQRGKHAQQWSLLNGKIFMYSDYMWVYLCVLIILNIFNSIPERKIIQKK